MLCDLIQQALSKENPNKQGTTNNQQPKTNNQQQNEFNNINQTTYYKID